MHNPSDYGYTSGPSACTACGLAALDCCPGIVPLWRVEFPDYPADDMPVIPAGFEDVSWHNDTCPSFHNAAARLTLFVDYLDVERREFPENGGRFSLSRTDDNGAVAEGIGQCVDDWSDMLAIIASQRRLA